jgi:hypothetical protein
MLIIVFILLAIGIATCLWAVHKTENPIPSLIAFVVFMVISLSLADAYDRQVLIERFEVMTLIDKWHEESCTPITNTEGGYAGESCSDEWTIVVDSGGVREQREVAGEIFKAFIVPAKLERRWKQGRLGRTHDVTWTQID